MMTAVYCTAAAAAICLFAQTECDFNRGGWCIFKSSGLSLKRWSTICLLKQ